MFITARQPVIGDLQKNLASQSRQMVRVGLTKTYTLYLMPLHTDALHTYLPTLTCPHTRHPKNPRDSLIKEDCEKLSKSHDIKWLHTFKD